ncbi:MAG: hypothetical protein ACT4NY_32225 [Pseudonocardiales bacterium]
MTVQVRPITDDDVSRVAEFLQAHLPVQVSAESWRRSFGADWNVDSPNHGFMLVDDEALAGAYLAYYANRTINGRIERFCNLGAWCVLPGYRFHSIRLLKALLAQPDYHFLDLSPSGNVIPLNQRLGFQFLDTTTALVPAIPWVWRSGTISADPATIERTLAGRELTLYRDHAKAAAARHVVLRAGDEWCYVVFRMDRRKRFPRVFASLLHVSNPELFHTMLRPLSGYLLLRHRALAMLAELRVVQSQPARSLILTSQRRKMYLSPTLASGDIDYFYSELVSVAW